MSAPMMHRAATQLPEVRRARRWSAADASGAIYQRAGANKNLALGHDKNPSTISRFEQGAAYAPCYKSVELLLKSPYTTAFPVMTEQWVIMSMEQTESLTNEQLYTRRKGYRQSMKEIDIAIDRAQERGESTRHLFARVADIALELAAIQTVLEARGEL